MMEKKEEEKNVEGGVWRNVEQGGERWKNHSKFITTKYMHFLFISTTFLLAHISFKQPYISM